MLTVRSKQKQFACTTVQILLVTRRLKVWKKTFFEIENFFKQRFLKNLRNNNYAFIASFYVALID
jgi:hypothetical protein